MAPSGDELAGIVDLFGALTREQLRRAVEETAFRTGREVDEGELRTAIATAIEEYRLVTGDPDGSSSSDGAAVDDADSESGRGSGPPRESGDAGQELLVVGPTAFPAPPEGAEDLPHIMDVDRRDPDREAVGRAVARRFRSETARAVDRGDRERIEHLLDVSYDVETWAPVALTDVRERLDDALAGE